MPGLKRTSSSAKSRKRKAEDLEEDIEKTEHSTTVDLAEAGPSNHEPKSSGVQDELQNLRELTAAAVDKETADEGVAKPKNKNAKRTSLKPKAAKKWKPEKCDSCRQYLDSPDLIFYEGHPEGAVEEIVALTNAQFQLFNGNEEDVHEFDQRPTNKITNYCMYDEEGHLCKFDGLVEADVLVYVSGYMKPVYDDDPSIENGVACFIGPLIEWWFAGYDGGSFGLIGVSTEYAEYYLMEPASNYQSFMAEVKLKSFLTKTVTEFLLDNLLEDVSYEHLLYRLQDAVPPPGVPKLDEEALLRNAQFLCEQLLSLNEAGIEDDENLILQRSIRDLIKLANVTFGKQKRSLRETRKKVSEKLPKWSKATTTDLVKDVFEAFFTDALDERETTPRRKRCETCEACQRPDCGVCTACLNMIKFGGTGTSKQACVLRRCPNMAVAAANDSDSEDDDKVVVKVKGKAIPPTTNKIVPRPVTWGPKVGNSDNSSIYTSCKMSEALDKKEVMDLQAGDFVMLVVSQPGAPRIIGQIKFFMQHLKNKTNSVHFQKFIHARNTLLGDIAIENEILQKETCMTCDIGAIDFKISVTRVDMPDNWAMLGGSLESNLQPFPPGDPRKFWYQKAYDEETGNITDLPPEPPQGEESFCCSVCTRNNIKSREMELKMKDELNKKGQKNELYFSGFTWNAEQYDIGSCVYIYLSEADIAKKKKPIEGKIAGTSAKDRGAYDEEKYPELERKLGKKEVEEKAKIPFLIGRILSVMSCKSKPVTDSDVVLRVALFYRPEDVHKGKPTDHFDLNLVYWSDEERDVKLQDVAGKCWVRCRDSFNQPPVEWTLEGPHRFYFTQAYNHTSKKIEDLTEQAINFGIPSTKGKGKGKGKGKKEPSEVKPVVVEPLPIWPEIARPLRCLDVFAGCGGLSEGLHQSGVAETKWAIEKEEPAANAFKLNNPECTMFTADCNTLLKHAMEGKTHFNGKQLPLKGDVELLCGGPPCQGFSGMNRFNSRQYSIFKNSLVVSYLSYCDYYRPKFFILENVRNFLMYKQNMVLRLTLRCLFAMGYQVCFAVLQAGDFLIPQVRRRAIIMAAAPGEDLPSFPEPWTVFSAKDMNVLVNEKVYLPGTRWSESAPLRQVTVKDAMSDLPAILNGADEHQLPYGCEPQSHIQRLARRKSNILMDHICKEMSALVVARISHIPTTPGSDWRDLPNIVVQLADGRLTNKLRYTHYRKNKVNGERKRGVCHCALSGKTDKNIPCERQDNTLIPWCLPHTADRYNHWALLYGRIPWEGYFRTTVANPEPMAKQGRVLHPEQNRVVSVRECARSQGFPDTFQFFGNILDKHRQIGNAVPPPLGLALGREIRTSVAKRQQAAKLE